MQCATNTSTVHARVQAAENRDAGRRINAMVRSLNYIYNPVHCVGALCPHLCGTPALKQNGCVRLQPSNQYDAHSPDPMNDMHKQTNKQTLCALNDTAMHASTSQRSCARGVLIVATMHPKQDPNNALRLFRVNFLTIEFGSNIKV